MHLRTFRLFKLIAIALVMSPLVLHGGCASQSRYELASVEMRRDFDFMRDYPAEGDEPQDYGLEPAVLTGFRGNILIDKETGETWLFVPKLNPEASSWQKLPRPDEPRR